MREDEPRLELAHFEKAAASTFVVRLDEERSAPLTLVEVSQRRAPSGWESFSLLFEGPDPAAFPHSTYEVEHDQMGAFALTVGPVHTEGPGQHYEAVFNRRAPEAPKTEGSPP